ncbi:MAG: DMT family transporter [Rhizobiaceae bacterium]|nr:DMT family transporter [Rhizobiaceae bacterium]
MHHRAAYTYLLLTALFWGGNAVAGKLAVGNVSPMLLVALRWSIAVTILAVIGWRQVRADWPTIRANLGLLFLLGALGFTCFNALFYTALIYTSAINVAIEQAGMPMVIFLLNFIIFRLPVSPAQIFGFILSITGVMLTAIHGDLTRLAALDVNLGDLLMLAAVLLYSGYTVALRSKPQIHWQSLMMTLAVSALLTSLPLVAWEYVSGNLTPPNLQGWSLALYIAIFPSLLAQIFFIRGNELIGGNRAGIFINMVPIFGTLLSIIIVGEMFQPYHAIAMALVFSGIWIAERSGRRMAAQQL